MPTDKSIHGLKLRQKTSFIGLKSVGKNINGTEDISCQEENVESGK